MANEKVYEILVVEDNPADARLLEIAWAECPVAKTRVHVLEQTKDVLFYLRGGEQYKDLPHPVPDLIMLDYVMPIDGGLALIQIKGDPEAKLIPVVVLTGLPTRRNLVEMYSRAANCCIQKPSELDGFLKMVCKVAEFWLTQVALPPKPKLETSHDDT